MINPTVLLCKFFDLRDVPLSLGQQLINLWFVILAKVEFISIVLLLNIILQQTIRLIFGHLQCHYFVADWQLESFTPHQTDIVVLIMVFFRRDQFWKFQKLIIVKMRLVSHYKLKFRQWKKLQISIFRLVNLCSHSLVGWTLEYRILRNRSENISILWSSPGFLSLYASNLFPKSSRKVFIDIPQHFWFPMRAYGALL